MVNANGPIQGRHGTGTPLPLPDDQSMAPLLQHWLVNTTGYDAPRSQFILAATVLHDIPGFEPAKKYHPEATHELGIHPLSGDELLDEPTALKLLVDRDLPVNPMHVVRAHVIALDPEVTTITHGLVAQMVHDFCPDPLVTPGIHSAWQALVVWHLTRLRYALRNTAPIPAIRS